jgi:hypothetical protein
MKNRYVIATVIGGNARYLTSEPGLTDMDNERATARWARQLKNADRYTRECATQLAGMLAQNLTEWGSRKICVAEIQPK